MMTLDIGETTASTTGHVPPPRPGRILVADDEHMVALGLKSQLHELGFAVVGPVADGEATVALARAERPDMVLLDIRMPRLDGIAAGEIISRQLGIPVIIVSAFSDKEYLDSCTKRFRTYGYLLKPVSLDDLRVTIEVAWSRFLETADSHNEIERLKTRLEQRKVIEQAKWILVKKKGISEPEAMKTLQRQARNNRRTLIDVAQAVIDNESLFSSE